MIRDRRESRRHQPLGAYEMTIRFDGRVAIVTGAGNGLGRDYAVELAKRGAKVVVNDLGGSGSGTGASHQPADAVVDAIRSVGGEAVASHDSVATRSGGKAIVRTALDAFGRVDIVINNAGFLRNNRFEDLSDSQIDAIVDVHLKGAFYVSQPAYRAMAVNKYGRFIFTGSTSAMFGHAWQANYAAAKGGLMGLSHIVAIEGSAHGIQSNLMLPNANSRLADEMTTGFHEIPEFVKSIQNADFSEVKGRTTPEFNTPLVLWLVSEQCKKTHGIFSQNGGRYAEIAIAAADGWVSPAGELPPTPEDIAAHADQIGNYEIWHRPLTVYDEFTAVSAATRRQRAGRSSPEENDYGIEFP
jgi:NAD(P)-dependent dehydrogenase (short-subunit alcohol dehydrogenase family)